jgi:alpha-mannosidase
VLIPKVENRIRQYIELLERNKYERLLDLKFDFLETREVFRSPPEKGDWNPAELPFAYGKEWTSYWFRTSFELPASAAGRAVFLQATPRADSLVFIDGLPSGALNPFHHKLRLSGSGEAGRRYRVHLESYAGHKYPGEHPFQREEVILTLGLRIPDYPNIFESASLLAKNEAIYGLYYDAFVLFDLALSLDQHSLRRARILRGLYDALGGLRFEARGAELEAQAAQAAREIAPLLAARNGDSSPAVHLVGHAHIDHAWLWPIAETERKAARTFANMTRYAAEFPEFVFIQSQPAQLEIVETEYPAIFAAVKAAYKAGQWEPNGGMWVEADCNLPSGESFVRQFLVGKAATRRMLGYEGDTLWLPDVFGYSAALPQILRGCGIEYFVTSKINWNDTTRFPYDTFLWRGIDGSEIKTHFITMRTDGYNGSVAPSRLLEAWREVQHKEVQESVISSIGEGDGGGGTKRSDLECARRLANLEGAPRARWTKASEALAQIFAHPEDLPQWKGELYLELHRGTYTTQGFMKRNNRRAEFAMRDCEFLSAVLAAQAERGAEAYPRAELLSIWKTMLTNQFHDIIPGSSIARVYRDAEASYAKAFSELGRLSARAMESLVEQASGQGSGAALARFAIFNSLSWARSSLVSLPSGSAGQASLGLLSTSGSRVPTQRLRGIDGAESLLALASVAPMGMEGFSLVPLPAAAASAVSSSPAAAPFIFEGRVLETPFYFVAFDPSMRIESLIDKKSGRQLVGEGSRLNAFQSAEDLPVSWDAWDIEADWKRSIVDESRLVSSEVASIGPLFIAIRNRYEIGECSKLAQDLVFRSFDKRIDFVTEVDWAESHRVLKAAFGTSVHAQAVRCEIQFGHVMRETHQNLPQDRARFEICAHKWICLEEPGSGIALLNDCKYGHDVSGSLMRLSLLRSPKAPDGEADMGHHRFTYALLPFEGAFADSGVVASAYDLNSPLVALDSGTRLAAPRSFFSLDDECVCIEAVKLAEQSGRTLLRLYETSGAPRKARLRCSAALRGAWSATMLEGDERPLHHGERELSLDFQPFEVKTLLLDLEGGA